MSDMKKIIDDLKKLATKRDIKIIMAQQPRPMSRSAPRPRPDEPDIIILDYLDRMAPRR